jgi:hypothetical protein
VRSDQLLRRVQRHGRDRARQALADVARPLRQHDALQLAHVAEPDFPGVHREHHPVVPVPFFAGLSPVQLSGHAEMHEQRRAACPGDQPVATPFRIAEPVAAQRRLEMRGTDAAKHPGVSYFDMLHPASRAVLGQHRAEARFPPVGRQTTATPSPVFLTGRRTSWTRVPKWRTVPPSVLNKNDQSERKVASHSRPR